MGSGFSAAALPISLDKETARAVTGSRFDEAMFDEAAVDGMVSRDAFLAALLPPRFFDESTAGKNLLEQDEIPQSPSLPAEALEAPSVPAATPADEVVAESASVMLLLKPAVLAPLLAALDATSLQRAACVSREWALAIELDKQPLWREHVRDRWPGELCSDGVHDWRKRFRMLSSRDNLLKAAGDKLRDIGLADISLFKTDLQEATQFDVKGADAAWRTDKKPKKGRASERTHELRRLRMAMEAVCLLLGLPMGAPRLRVGSAAELMHNAQCTMRRLVAQPAEFLEHMLQRPAESIAQSTVERVATEYLPGLSSYDIVVPHQGNGIDSRKTLDALSSWVRAKVAERQTLPSAIYAAPGVEIQRVEICPSFLNPAY